MGNAEVIRINPLRAANTHPTANTIYGVWSDKNGTAFAAAENGTIFKWDGSGITPQFYDDRTVDFYDIFGFSKTDVWAVGTFGEVGHFDGNKWSHITQIVTNECKDGVWLEAVWGRSPTDLYVAGARGAIFHFDGNAWTQVDTKVTMPDGKKVTIHNRIYSLSGLDTGEVYAVGSFGTILKIKPGQPMEKIATGSQGSLNGIQVIPQTSKFIVCGSDGTLFWLENDVVTHILHTIYDARFYAVDAVDKNAVMVVGWKGNAGFFDGTKWEFFSVGDNSYLEGVVFNGQGQFFSGGWYGRIMTFDIASRQWSSHQTGRAEKIISLAVNDSDSIVATTDTGNILFGNKTSPNLELLFAPPLDLNIAAPLSGNKFLVAGEQHYIAELNLNDNPPTLAVISTNLSKDIRCGARLSGSVFLSGADGKLIKYDGASAVEIPKFKQFQCTKNRTIPNLVCKDQNVFCIQRTDDKIFKLDLQNNTELELACPENPFTLFGGGGSIYGFGNYTLYRLELQDQYDLMVDVTSDLLTSGEKIISAVVFGTNHLVCLGGSRGTLILVDGTNTPPVVTSFSCGSVRSVIALDGNDSMICAGLVDGIVQIVNLNDFQVLKSHRISAPIYHSVSGMDGGFLFCGQGGNVAFLADGSDKAVQGSMSPRDFLAALQLDSKKVYCGGVNQIAIYNQGTLVKNVDLDKIIVTTMSHDGTNLFIGTSNGSVLSCPIAQIEGNTFRQSDLTTVAGGLGGSVVGLHILANKIRVILEDGRILYSDQQAQTLYHFPMQSLKQASLPESTNTFYVAGETSFLCRIEDYRIEIFNIPETIYSVTLHGKMGPGDYWAGGTSGTLLLLKGEKWFKVHVGIGNHLHSVAERNGRVVVCGRFGAIRFDNTQFIIDVIGMKEVPEETGVLLVNAQPIEMRAIRETRLIDPDDIHHLNRQIPSPKFMEQKYL